MYDASQNGLVLRLPSTYLNLYPRVNVALSQGHRNSSSSGLQPKAGQSAEVSCFLVVDTKCAPMLSPAKPGEHNTEERLNDGGVLWWDAIFWTGQDYCNQEHTVNVIASMGHGR